MTADGNAAGRARIESLLALRRWDEATRQLAWLLASAPNDAALLVLLTRACVGAGRLDDALDGARAAVGANPDLYEAHYWHTTVLLALSEPALDGARRTVDLAPQNPFAWFLVTRAELQSGDLDSARDAAETALRISPAQPIGHHALGLVHLRTREWRRAEADYRAALALAPTNTTYLNNLGLALLHQGDAKRAAEHFVSAGELAPADADTYRRNAAISVRRFLHNPDPKTRRQIGIPVGGAALIIVIVFAHSPAIVVGSAAALMVAAIVAYRRRLRQLPQAARFAARSERQAERQGLRGEFKAMGRELRRAFSRAPWRWPRRQWAFVTMLLAILGLIVLGVTATPQPTILRVPYPAAPTTFTIPTFPVPESVAPPIT